MVITGKIKLFVETKEAEEGRKFKVFSTSISSKVKDTENYIHKSMGVTFSAENFPSETLNKLQDNKVYDLDLVNSWLAVRSYKDKDGNEKTTIYLMVNKATLTGSKEIKKQKEQDDLPF